MTMFHINICRSRVLDARSRKIKEGWGKVFALRAHCVCTACALRGHCVRTACTLQ